MVVEAEHRDRRDPVGGGDRGEAAGAAVCLERAATWRARSSRLSSLPCPPPRKPAPAPVGPGTIEKLTDAPCTGLPLASATRACKRLSVPAVHGARLRRAAGGRDRGGEAGGGVGEGELDGAEVGVGVDRVAAGGEVRREGGRGRDALRVRADDGVARAAPGEAAARAAAGRGEGHVVAGEVARERAAVRVRELDLQRSGRTACPAGPAGRCRPRGRARSAGSTPGRRRSPRRRPAPEAARATASARPTSKSVRFMLPPLIGGRRRFARPGARSDAGNGLRSRARG